ncbi:uncharacterized protein LOC114293087 isoform X2 [Camellia sinensis]|uniref:uncharacterized protein LOC114293087 isoform X2 n=1 Tax=Camellia sinensis TaxID=4442 RepID=UPI001036D333|nr:uncharacterized protein LOC114293087 isoform X2 [Camellia sinensis]
MMTELKRSILDVVLFIDSHINPAKSKRDPLFELNLCSMEFITLESERSCAVLSSRAGAGGLQEYSSMQLNILRGGFCLFIFFLWLAFQNLLPHYYDSLMSNATIKQANWDSSKVRTKLRQELRDEIRDELREEMWAELSTQIQQVKVEMLVIVSQEGSTNHNKQVLDALSGHREPTDYEADENPHTPPPDDAM